MAIYLLFAFLARKLIDAIEGLMDAIADDTLVQRGLEADLGLPPGSLDKAKVARPDMSGIDEYISAVDPDAEKLKVAFDSIAAYARFWTTVFDAAKTEDPSIVVDELVYRLFEYATVELLKFEHPRGYAWMRLLGVIQYDVRTALEETLAPEVPANIFTADYWRAMPAAFERNYHNFRLDQASDFSLQDPADADPPLPPEEVTSLRQLGVPVFAWSDTGFFGFWIIVTLSRWLVGDRDVKLEQFYGWELPFHQRPPLCIEPSNRTGIPISDHIASRGYTVRISTAAGAPASSSATLTQLLFVDEEGDFGWLFALRGAVTFEEKAGSKQRPIKIAVKVDARDGVNALVRFSGENQFSFTGTPSGGMQLAISPAQPATAGPAIALPDATGTRLEIGDFSFVVDLSKDGFKIKAATRKSALVIVTGDGDSFIEDSLGATERRIEFDLGATADQNGVSLDGGGRLATTLPLDFSLGPVKVREVQLALGPAGTPTSSELALTAAVSFTFSVSWLKIVVEQIGMTFNIGSTRGTSPDDALELGSSLLYFRNAGFKPPAGLGIRVDSDFVNGGGFLFYDKEKEEYAGVLQLDFGPRFTFTAIGLLTTKLPDGGKGYSFLIILSLELDPPWRIGPLGIGGLGGLFGLRRALDTDALRAGLRNRTLDAVLFPKDPVTNAGRLLAALRTVFPPTRDKHVAGPMLLLTWGAPTIVTAELAPSAARAAARILPAQAREEADRDQHRRARDLGSRPRRLLAGRTALRLAHRLRQAVG